MVILQGLGILKFGQGITMRCTGIAAGLRLFLTLSLGGMAALPLDAQPPPKKDAKPPAAIKLPSGATIVVIGNPESLDKPEAIYLSPEKYKELTDQIEQLKKQIAAEKAVPPSSCELEGRLEQRGSQTVARLKATFKFRTTAPRTLVNLGCAKAHPIEAKIDDGKLPMLAGSDKGLTVQVQTMGEHTIQIELELPLLPRGLKGETGFELGLPGAPITTLTFEPPAKTKRVTISRREVGSAPSTTEPVLDVNRLDAERLMPGKGGEALGPATYLAVSWENPAEPANVENKRSAELEMQVTIGETDIRAEGRLRLKGAMKEWRFQAPSNAEVTVGRAPPPGSAAKPIDFAIDQAPEVVRPEPGKSDWRIRFRETSAAELLVVIGTRSPRNRGADPKSKTIWQAGPFAALDLPKQEGTIRVKSLPHIRAVAALKGDTQRVDGSDDPNAEAIYRFRSLPQGPNNTFGAPLELDIRAAAGMIQTRVHHYLNFGEGGWRLRSEMTVTPIRMDVDALDLEVPVPGFFEASSPKLVEGIVSLRDSGPKRRVIQVKLAAAQRNAFTIAIEGFYPVPLGVQEATLVLPKPLNVFDRNGQVTVAVPDGFDLHGGASQWESDRPGKRIHPLEFSAVKERTPTMTTNVGRAAAQVELSWKPLRADVRVDSQISVALGDRQARVAQQLHYSFADQPLKNLRLRGPASLTGVSVNPGSIEINAPGDWTMHLPVEPNKEAVITLSYSFPMLAAFGNSTMEFPIIWPDGVTACSSRVRIARDRAAINHLLPSLEAGSWQEIAAEFGPSETLLPLLTLRATGVDLPLIISLRDAGAGPGSMPNVWIDRAFIQAQDVDGGQRYRARFHLGKWTARTLELQMPGGATEIETRIDGIRSDVRGALANAKAGPTLNVPLPAPRERQRLLVEVTYRLATGRGNGFGGLVGHWEPPQPKGRVAVSSIRWQVAVPNRTTPLSIGDAVFEERWAVRNGFAQPVAAHSPADLEKWIASGQEPMGGDTPPGWEMAEGGVTAHQAGLGPLRIVVIPRTVWLLTVSLIVLAIGLIVSRLPRRAVGVIFVSIAAATVVAGYLWPQLAGHALAAAQPGLAILAFVLGLQRVLQERYRRRLARLPGFSRIQAESALSQSNGKPGSREPAALESPARM